MTNKDPIIRDATDTWEVAGTIVAIHDGQVPRGFVRLHANLIRAWDDLAEAKRALEIPYIFTDGQHLADLGYQLDGTPRWLPVDILDLQTDFFTRTGEDLPRESLVNILVARCGELAALLQSTSAYKEAGLSVKPAELDYDEERVRSLAAPNVLGQLAVIALRRKQKAWVPGSGYMFYRGPGNARYQFTTHGVDAEFIKEFD